MQRLCFIYLLWTTVAVQSHLSCQGAAPDAGEPQGGWVGGDLRAKPCHRLGALPAHRAAQGSIQPSLEIPMPVKLWLLMGFWPKQPHFKWGKLSGPIFMWTSWRSTRSAVMLLQ